MGLLASSEEPGASRSAMIVALCSMLTAYGLAGSWTRGERSLAATNRQPSTGRAVSRCREPAAESPAVAKSHGSAFRRAGGDL